VSHVQDVSVLRRVLGGKKTRENEKKGERKFVGGKRERAELLLYLKKKKKGRGRKLG